MDRINCGDAAADLPADHHIWRKFNTDDNHVTWEGGLPHPYPAVPNEYFRIRPEEDGLSGWWAEHLKADGKGPLDCLDPPDDRYTGVGELLIEDAVGIGCKAEHKPVPPPEPITCAHSIIHWQDGEYPAGSDQASKARRKALMTRLASIYPIRYGEILARRPE